MAASGSLARLGTSMWTQILIRKDKPRKNQDRLVADIIVNSPSPSHSVCTPCPEDSKAEEKGEKGVGEVSYANIGMEGLVQVYVYNVEVKEKYRKKGIGLKLLSHLHSIYPHGPFCLRFHPDPCAKSNVRAAWRLYRRWAIANDMQVVEISPNQNSNPHTPTPSTARSDPKSDTKVRDNPQCHGPIVIENKDDGVEVNLEKKDYVPELNSTLWFVRKMSQGFSTVLSVDNKTWKTVNLTVINSPIGSGAFGTGWRLWDSSILLSRFLEPCKDPEENYFPLGHFYKKRVHVLELGAGVGLVSMVLASLGAHVIVTDRPEVVANVSKKNIEANNNAIKATKHGGKVTILPLDWGWAVSEKEEGDDTFTKEFIKKLPSGSGPKFDLIVGADLVFHSQAIGPLIRTVKRVMRPGGEMLMTHKNRREEVKQEMIAAFKAAGMDVGEMPTKLSMHSVFRISWQEINCE